MPRYPETIPIPRFAEDGMRMDPDADDFDNAVDSREEGFDQSFSQVGGKRPDYRVFNQIMFEKLAAFHYIYRVGLPLPWSQHQDYVHSAFVKGSNGRVYRSKANSGPATSDATNPVTDTNETKWEVY